MSDLSFTRQNIMPSPMQGYQLKAVAVGANGFFDGFTNPFNALIDPGARHTSVSKSIMNKILLKIRDENNGILQQRGTAKVAGVYGKQVEEPVYIVPRFYLGGFCLKNVVVIASSSDNFQCLIGRSILHQCILTLNPELNNITFDFKDCLKTKKALIDGLLSFEEVYQFAEFDDFI